jgi:hypothetical protein
MKTQRFLTAAAASLLFAPAACNNFLTGGELSTDPNRVTQATTQLLFAGTQANIWTFLGSDLARVSSLFTQQLFGAARQQATIYNYGTTEGTAGGFFSAVYAGGGLVDLRQVEEQATTANDRLFLGIAQTEEALLVGEAASVFGNIVYTKALTGPNPPLDPQLVVYDSVQVLLDRAITNLRSTVATNAGPGTSDLNYGGNATKWRRLAYTLKARFYMHTAEVRGPSAYAAALAASDSGITNSADDYRAIYSGGAGEQNLTYQFQVVQRAGDIEPNPQFVDFLTTRNDPRVDLYFNADRSDINPKFIGAAGSGNAPTIFVSASENLLIGAEAAFKTGDHVKALALLNKERTTTSFPSSVGASYTLTPYPATTTDAALLQAILDEKYTVEFLNIEAFNDYKRNCYPNIAPVAGASSNKIPARLLYDLAERNANSSIPTPDKQGTRNPNDPANVTDPFGNACLGQ